MSTPLEVQTTGWRPIMIGPFYYATNGAETSKQNWVMRDGCADHCRRLNDPTYDPTA